MRLYVIPSPFYAANGLVFVPSEAGTAPVVDPSAGIQHPIREVLELGDMSMGAVLLTYGHPDHVQDVTVVSTQGVDGGIVPVYVPRPDMYCIDVLASSLPVPLPDSMREWVKPADLREMPSDSFKVYPGAWLRMVPTPGYAEGPAVFPGESPLDVRVNSQSFYRSGETVP